MQQTDDRQSILSMRGIRKSFAGVQALKGVSLELYPGEVLGLIGGKRRRQEHPDARTDGD